MPKSPTGPEPTTMIVDRYDPVNLFELVPKLERVSLVSFS